MLRHRPSTAARALAADRRRRGSDRAPHGVRVVLAELAALPHADRAAEVHAGHHPALTGAHRRGRRTRLPALSENRPRTKTEARRPAARAGWGPDRRPALLRGRAERDGDDSTAGPSQRPGERRGRNAGHRRSRVAARPAGGHGADAGGRQGPGVPDCVRAGARSNASADERRGRPALQRS